MEFNLITQSGYHTVHTDCLIASWQSARQQRWGKTALLPPAALAVAMLLARAVLLVLLLGLLRLLWRPCNPAMLMLLSNQIATYAWLSIVVHQGHL